MTDRSRRRSGAPDRNAATCLAMFVLISCALGFVAFTAVILPQIRGAILVIGGLSLFFLLHYCTWGAWMQRIREQEAEADAGAREQNPGGRLDTGQRGRNSGNSDFDLDPSPDSRST